MTHASRPAQAARLVLVAAALYRLVEKPGLALRERVRRRFVLGSLP